MKRISVLLGVILSLLLYSDICYGEEKGVTKITEAFEAKKLLVQRNTLHS